MRKRDIDPGVWRSEQFLALPSDSARLTFLAMISLADDLGVGRVSDVLRYTSITPHVTLSESVVKAGLAVLFEEGDGLGRRCLYLLPNWCRYQYVNRPSRGKLPLPADWKDLVPVEYHGRYKDRVVDPHGALPATEVAPSPSPSPLEKRDATHLVAGHPAYDLALHLRDSILSHSPDHKCQQNGTVERWARDVDLAMRRDGRTVDGLRAVIDFAHRDPAGDFWKPNIQSGKKLRAKFDTLAMQAKRPGPVSGPLDDEFWDSIHKDDDATHDV